MLTTPRRRLGALAILTLAALLTLAAAARASTIQIDLPDGQPVQDAPTILHLTGTIPDGAIAAAQAHVAPLHDAPRCSYLPGVFTRQISERIWDDTFDMTPSVTFTGSGKWLVCAWVWIVGFGGDDPGAVTSTIVEVRPPLLRVQIDAPRLLAVGRLASASIAYSAEANRQLFVAAVRGRCWHSWRTARSHGGRLLLGGRPVIGDGGETVPVRLALRGKTRICAYLQRDAADGNAGAIAGTTVEVTGRRGAAQHLRDWELR